MIGEFSSSANMEGVHDGLRSLAELGWFLSRKRDPGVRKSSMLDDAEESGDIDMVRVDAFQKIEMCP